MSECSGQHETSNPLSAMPATDAQPVPEDSSPPELSGMTDAEVAALTSTDLPSAAVPEPGAELKGRVVGTGGDSLFVDVGLRSQAIVPISQFSDDGEEIPQQGTEVDVVVDRYDASTDLLHVHRKGAVQAADVDSLRPGALLEGQVTGMVKGGLEMQFGKVRGFMPASQVDPDRIKDISIFIGQRIRCEVLEIEKKSKNVVVSRRRIVQEEMLELKEKLLSELEVGQTRSGEVKNLTEYGAFVDLGGVHGLLHISDMSWKQVDKPSDVLKTGDKIDVKVLKINRERNRISLGLKQITPDPWSDVEEKYPVGTQLKVRVVKLADFGAFAEVVEGVNGLIPLSEMSWSQRPSGPREMVEEGQMVDVVVISVDCQRRRIGLSIKQLAEDPWHSIMDAYPVDSIVTGKVSKLLDFGALIELHAGVEGLVHISELSMNRVKSTADVVKIGDEVRVKVLSADAGKRRIALSIKAVIAENETPAEAEETPAKKDKPKRKKPLRGGLASHFDW